MRLILGLVFAVSSSVWACTGQPFLVLLDSGSVQIETNLYSGLMFQTKGEGGSIELVSALDRNQADFSGYLNVQKGMIPRDYFSKRKWHVFKKWKKAIDRSSLFLEPAPRDLTPLQFFARSPITLKLKTAPDGAEFSVEILISKNSIEKKGKCEFAPRLLKPSSAI